MLDIMIIGLWLAIIAFSSLFLIWELKEGELETNVKVSKTLHKREIVKPQDNLRKKPKKEVHVKNNPANLPKKKKEDYKEIITSDDITEQKIEEHREVIISEKVSEVRQEKLEEVITQTTLSEVKNEEDKEVVTPQITSSKPKKEDELKLLNEAYESLGISWENNKIEMKYLQASNDFIEKLKSQEISDGYKFEETISNRYIADYILLPNNKVVLNFYKYNYKYKLDKVIIMMELENAIDFKDKEGNAIKLQRNKKYSILQIEKPILVDEKLSRVAKGVYRVEQV